VHVAKGDVAPNRPTDWLMQLAAMEPAAGAASMARAKVDRRQEILFA